MMIRKRSQDQATELGDADIIESVDAKPLRSGTFPAARVPHDDYDDEGTPTTLSEQTNDVLVELARLTDPAKTPQLCANVRWDQFAREEAWIITLVLSQFTVEAILEASPFGADHTIEVLAKLVCNRVIVLR